MEDPDDYNSPITLTSPVNSEKIVVGATIRQVAPDRFLHPIHILRRHLDALPGNRITEAKFGIRLVNTYRL